MSAELEITILGCGSSGGVPRIGNDWGSCDPRNPKNRRRRCSILVRRIGEAGVTTVLIDTGPDMREQMPYAKVLSAGWVAFDGETFVCTGGSLELNVQARREDVAIIAGQFAAEQTYKPRPLRFPSF